MPTAIVLTTNKYSDTGSIVHLYTPDQGRVQCVVYGNKLKGVLRPLSIVEYSSSRRNNAPLQMQTLSSASLVYTPTLLSYDVLRQCVAMFIAELAEDNVCICKGALLRLELLYSIIDNGRKTPLSLLPYTIHCTLP